jgi:4-amino-4-deoxy-L-arabinose transferase-like glycosyltransferase
MSARPNRGVRAALWIAFALGAAIRLNNALLYPPLWGFDAIYNWHYVERLLGNWALPQPTEGWAFGHPPLFYYLASMVVLALGPEDPARGVIAVRLLSSCVGLGAIAATVALVRRLDPENEVRALFAAGLLLFLPAQIQLSATFGEEILVSALVTGALALVSFSLATPTPPHDLRRSATVGLLTGIAWLTKLSGVLVLPAAIGSYLLAGLRRRELPRSLLRCATVCIVVAVSGGWYYARNFFRYGALYPEALPNHALMYTMPPGTRTASDYLFFPLSTFTNPQLLDPDLLHSVWGSTYATLWFDGHRHFLATNDPLIQRAGALILLLALLPTLAFAVGVLRGIRRSLRAPGGPDTPLLLALGLYLVGYILFTWRNPWFATLKGSYLLGAMLPFAFYASETLAAWSQGPRWRRMLVWSLCCALAVAVTLVFSYGLCFTRTEVPGLHWLRG